MVRSDDERRAKVSGAALDAFAPLTANPKSTSADRKLAGSTFGLGENRPVLRASPLAIDGDALVAVPPASPVPEEVLQAKEVDSMVASLPPEPPRTDLGRKLWGIRQRIVASGSPLLDWDQIEAEVGVRRGERA